MTPSRPYLIRAINEWILDNSLTPYLLVDAQAPAVEVPERYVENGKIVLNINPRAINGLVINNQEITFSARFSGTPVSIYIPVSAVLAIYAQENGRGMMFNDEEDEPEPPGNGPEPGSGKSSRPTLKVVK
jgi:stringent starvation protein B